jgi:protein-L-isoaspartate(D-aspartate) O-methyltransferase
VEKDFAKLRKLMVETQLKPRGIADPRVLAAMEKVPRDKFVPADILNVAYEDCALPIGERQTISQPFMVAVMTECLKLKGDERVLEIGTGSGYQAAILGELAKEVYTIERVGPLAERAETILKKLGYNNVKVIVGDGTLGYQEASPFDGIIVTAAAPSIPQPLIDQLADGGRLVIPVGETFSQILTMVTKQGTELITEESVGCVFVPLVGRFGWKESW